MDYLQTETSSLLWSKGQRFEKGIDFPYVIDDVSMHLSKASWVPSAAADTGNLSRSAVLAKAWALLWWITDEES